MKELKNVYACLVHEEQDCVVDLVRNLLYYDATSTVLLYNGGGDSTLLDDNPVLENPRVLIVPQPKRMAWGRLHDYFLDCTRFALRQLSFDVLTVVDSDQLAVQHGYSEFLSGFLALRPRVGMLGTTDAPLPASTNEGPVVAARREARLWYPLLDKFGVPRDSFPMWTFWPSTVFTRDAARDLVHLFDTDATLRSILARSRIWATEEIILPSLVAMLGYEIAVNPCHPEYVQYRRAYSEAQLEDALMRPEVHWVHPIQRSYDDASRALIRRRCDNYRVRGQTAVSLMRPGRALRRAEAIEGWLERSEAELLVGAAIQAARSEGVHDFVEVGSFCGKATTLLASVLQALSPSGKVYAVDPHDGLVGAEGNLLDAGPTLERFQRSLALAGVVEQVQVLTTRSPEVAWNRPISLLLIDGLHDYESVRTDFEHFAPHLAPQGLVLFHDYAAYYPGVVRFVDELLATSHELFQRAGTLVVLRARRPHAVQHLGSSVPRSSDMSRDAQPLAASAE